MTYPFALLIALAGILVACATVKRPLHDLCVRQMVANGFAETQAINRCRNVV